MPTKNLGRVSIVPKGTWNANTVYNRLDAVVHDGSSWIAKKQNKGQMPGEGSDAWQLLAERGADGRQGIDGAPGKGLTIIGHFDTVESLEASVTMPEPGDAYSVGTVNPYDIYTYDGVLLSWLNNGPLQGMEGPQGPKGDQGDVGPQGPAGSDASVTAENIKTALGYTPGMTNPNLLDNPWFQVNQRGKSSYKGAIYGVDRWKSRSDNITVTVNSDGSITIKNNGTSTAYFSQYVEDGALPEGKYTLSVNVLGATGTPNSYGNYGSAYLAYGSGPSISSNVGIKSNGEKIYSIALNPTDNVVRVQFDITAGCSITLKAVKLESGYVSTLANDSEPNYAVELVKCQRYYLRIGGKATFANAIGVASSDTAVNFIIPIPVSLRTYGTADITYGGNLFAALSSNSSDKFSITGVTLAGVQKNCFWVIAETSGVTRGSAYYLRFEGSSSVESFLAISKDL